MEISVKPQNDEEFLVTVNENASVSDHVVTLDEEYYKKLSDDSPEEFIKKCFEFLLEREPKEQIMQGFNIKEIQEFFPEFEKKISNSNLY